MIYQIKYSSRFTDLSYAEIGINEKPGPDPELEAADDAEARIKARKWMDEFNEGSRDIGMEHRLMALVKKGVEPEFVLLINERFPSETTR